ncbi:hypothetical protein A7R75_28385 [Mycolicibacterium llatzerense]|nr:hypothetical protein [Mycolicibacterium llatzerense]
MAGFPPTARVFRSAVRRVFRASKVCRVSRVLRDRPGLLVIRVPLDLRDRKGHKAIRDLPDPMGRRDLLALQDLPDLLVIRDLPDLPGRLVRQDQQGRPTMT